jgi:tetratricopeptide (TPR) repeat protein
MATRQRKWLIAFLAIGGLAAGSIAWYRLRTHSLPTALPPEIPSMVVADDVRDALTKARDKVLAKPNSGEAWGDLGVLFRAHKILPQANACFAEAAKLEPRNPRWPYLIGIDNLLLYTVKADSVPYFRTSYSIATDKAEKSVARLQLAEALLDQNELDEATKLFLEELGVAPDNPRAQFGLGVAAITRNDIATAIAQLTIAAKSPYYRHKASTLLVSCHKQLGNSADADRYARESILPPNDLPWPDPFDSGLSNLQLGPSARQHKVMELGSQASIEDVLNLLEEIARKYPNDPTQIPRAFQLLKLGDYPGVEKVCREVVAADPNNVTGRCLLGTSLYFQAVAKWNEGNREAARTMFEAALTELKKSIELKPDFGFAYLHVGYAFKYLGKLPEAAEAFRTAIQVIPHDPNTHLGLGEVLNDMGKPSEAIPHLEDAARLSRPTDNRAKALLEKIRDKSR